MFLKNKETNEQRERVINFKRTFATPEGKGVLFDLMNRYHLLNSHDGDPYKEGQRSVVLFIMAQTNINIQTLDQLLKGENE